MDWIRKQARLYQNLAQTMRYQAVVHLEDKEDESFGIISCRASSQAVTAICITAKARRVQIVEAVSSVCSSDPILQTASLSA